MCNSNAALVFLVSVDLVRVVLKVLAETELQELVSCERSVPRASSSHNLHEKGQRCEPF